MSRKLTPLPEDKRTPLTELLFEKFQEHGLTLESVGDQVGHQWTVVSKILKGKMRIPIDKIEPYAKAIHVEPLVLLKMVYPTTVEIVQRCLRQNRKTSSKE